LVEGISKTTDAQVTRLRVPAAAEDVGLDQRCTGAREALRNRVFSDVAAVTARAFFATGEVGQQRLRRPLMKDRAALQREDEIGFPALTERKRNLQLRDRTLRFQHGHGGTSPGFDLIL
jgi:hypothetical protein